MKKIQTNMPNMLILLRASTPLFAGLLMLLQACGGSAPKPKAGATTQTEAPTQESDDSREGRSAKAFADLSKILERLGQDDAIDPAWLRGELKAVLAIDSDHSGARHNLAVLDGKADAFEDIADDDDTFAPALENLAALLVDKGEHKDAEEIYERIIASDKKNVTSRLGLARLRFVSKRYKEAIDLCRVVLQQKADAIEAFRVLARSYYALGNEPMSELIIGRGLKVDKVDIELQFLMAEILLKRGDLAAGVDKLKEVVRLDPKRLDVRGKLAAIALSYRDYGNSSQQYEAILKERAAYRPAVIGLAVSYKGLGRYQQATDMYKKLLVDDSDDLDALWNVAAIYHRNLNDYDKAIEFYSAFQKKAPKGDKNAARIPKLVKEARAAKNNLAEQRAREERERRRAEAIKASCNKVAQGEVPTKEAEGIGNENERVEVAWQLMVDAQNLIQGGDMEGGESRAQCAFGVLPNTQQAKVGACAPMYVHWTQILYQLNRIPDASVAIDAALECDPTNPDAQLIKQQLGEILAQSAAESGDGAAPGADVDPEGAGMATPKGGAQ